MHIFTTFWHDAFGGTAINQLYRVGQKKYTRLMSHNNASIASILKVRLVLDR